MNTLSRNQRIEIVNMISESFGSDLDFDEFAEVVLGMLEDISGFETASKKTLSKLTESLWRKYHEENR